ncbi:MAG: hypothetical protein ABL982_09885 [Vicinamibacterales bacterium]
MDLLFAQAARRPDVAGAPVSQFSLWDQPDGGLRVMSNGDTLALGTDLGDAALKLQEAATAALAGANTTGLVFHAAAITYGRGAIVLPGRSGSGKTTLSAHVEHAGGVCLSDETTCVWPDRTVEGFRRPFNVKPNGLHLFSRLAGGDLDGAPPKAPRDMKSLAGPTGTLVTFGRTLPEPAFVARPRLCALVFPRYVARAEARCRTLGAAPAALHLMGSLLNARNLEGHGFETVTGLAREIPAYQLEYGDAGAAVALLEQLLEQGGPIGGSDT